MHSPAGFSGRQLGQPIKKNGFTLIELLVVVAIIGVLFAVALPVFGNAGRKDTYRAAQQVATTLRLARQHAIATRQWTFVIFPNRDGFKEGKYSTNKKDVNHYSKCLRSYAVIAATNNLDRWRVNADKGPQVNGSEEDGKMYFDFVSDWKYLPEGVYFDDTEDISLKKGNYLFGHTKDGTQGYNANANDAEYFKFPYDPADPNNMTKTMKMSAVLFKPNGRYYRMSQYSGQDKQKHWSDNAGDRIYITSEHFFEIGDDGSYGDPVIIPGTNTMLQMQGKTGMVKILEAAQSN